MKSSKSEGVVQAEPGWRGWFYIRRIKLVFQTLFWILITLICLQIVYENVDFHLLPSSDEPSHKREGRRHLGAFEEIESSPYLMAPLLKEIQDWKYDDIVINYLFLNVVTMEQGWLFKKHDQTILDVHRPYDQEDRLDCPADRCGLVFQVEKTPPQNDAEDQSDHISLYFLPRNAPFTQPNLMTPRLIMDGLSSVRQFVFLEDAKALFEFIKDSGEASPKKGVAVIDMTNGSVLRSGAMPEVD